MPSLGGVIDLVHPDDRLLFRKQLESALSAKRDQAWAHRIVSPVGAIKHVQTTARPFFDGSGTLTEYFGVTIDVTEFKRLAEEREHLQRRLAIAQDEERRRIARELHDAAAQRLALMEMEVDAFTTQPVISHEQALKCAEQLKRHMTELSNELRELAHQLHPSILEHLGLRLAFEQLVEQFAERWAKPVEWFVSAIPDRVLPNVATAVYRITQEALRNISKHATGACVLISLKGSDVNLLLRIEDDGPGFLYKKSENRAGLGLTGMAERLHLVRGKLVIRARPGKGTRIYVRVPLR